MLILVYSFVYIFVYNSCVVSQRISKQFVISSRLWLRVLCTLNKTTIAVYINKPTRGGATILVHRPPRVAVLGKVVNRKLSNNDRKTIVPKASHLIAFVEWKFHEHCINRCMILLLENQLKCATLVTS